MKPMSLQDYFLNTIRKEDLNATFFLVNGFQLKGVIKSFDQFTVIVDSDGKQQMIYKHALSTIIPEKPVELSQLSSY